MARRKRALMYILFFAALFVAMHFETKSIGVLKVSHLWKAGLAAFLVLTARRKTLWKGYAPLIVLTAMSAIGFDMFLRPIEHAVDVFNLAIVLVFALFLGGKTTAQLMDLMFTLAVCVVIAFIPYGAGVVESIGTGYDLESYGYSSITGLIGPFQSAHGAAISLASSLVVITVFLLTGRENRLFCLFLLCFGGLFLMQTYVRTGLLMYAVGMLAALLSNARYWKRAHWIVVAFALVLLVVADVGRLDVLKDRILGDGLYRNEDTLYQLGSGRGGIYSASLKIFWHADIREQLVGMSKVEQMLLIGQKTGTAVGSHNAFLDILLVNGAIGLILFGGFLLAVFRLILNAPVSFEKSLAAAIFGSYLSMCLVQGLDWMIASFFLVSSVQLCRSIARKRKYEDSGRIATGA